jgi:hypothetical protein
LRQWWLASARVTVCTTNQLHYLVAFWLGEI